jgi:3-mercaptopyruvate sulfurtransferase SseA
MFTDIETCPYAFQEMPVPQMEKLFHSWGVSPNLKIDVYDEFGFFMRPDSFIPFSTMDFRQESVHSRRGLAKWQEYGLPITKDILPPPKREPLKLKNQNEELHARLPEFLTANATVTKTPFLKSFPPSGKFGQA